MSVNIKKNQVLQFKPVNDNKALAACSCNSGYCQPVQTNDIISLQGTVDRVGNNLVGAPNTWTYGDGWNFNILSAQPMAIGYNITNATSQLVTNALTLIPFRRYALYFDIRTQAVLRPTSALFSAPNSILLSNIPNPQFEVGKAISVVGTASNATTFTIQSVYIYPGGDDIAITTVENTVVNETVVNPAVHLSQPYYEPTPNQGYRIKVNGAYLTLPLNGPDTQFQKTSQSYLLRYVFEWNTIVDDFIRIECTTPNQEIYINDIQVSVISQVQGTLYKDGAFLGGGQLPVAYFPFDTHALNPYGAASLPFEPVLWQWDIDFSNFFNAERTGCHRIGIFDVYANDGNDPLTAVSNCFNIQPVHDCTLLFNARNNHNAFGFIYGLGFGHYLRVKCKMDTTAYPEETETPYIFSNNNRVLMFARRDKEFTLFVTDAPDHIHDLLSIMRLHDEFYIGTNNAAYTDDLKEYVKESAYELNRRKTSSLKQATFTVREKQGLASNFACR